MAGTIEAVREQLKQVRTRVLTTIDAFRPKLIIKEPLTGILPGQVQGRINAEALLERIQNRIQELKTGIGLQTTGESVKPMEIVEHKEKKKTGFLY